MKNQGLKCFFCAERFTVLCLILFIQTTASSQDNIWKERSPIPTERGFTSGVSVDDHIYIIGGFLEDHSATGITEKYDPVLDEWMQLADMPEGRCAHATCSWNGKIYVFGGLSPDAFSTACDEVYEYDPQTDVWSVKKNMPYPIAFCGISVVKDTIYLSGGMTSFLASPTSRMLAYYPKADSFVLKANMPTPRGWLSSSVLNGKIYTLGGTKNYQNSSYKLVEVYTPETDTWGTAAEMITSRLAFGACVCQNKLFIMGGFNPSKMTQENEMYDPDSDTWISKTPMPDIRHTFFLGSVQDSIYAIGGSYPDPENPSNAIIPETVQLYNPDIDTVSNVLSSLPKKTRSHCIMLTRCYPTPASGRITIESQTAGHGFCQLTILDYLGKVIDRKVLPERRYYELNIGKYKPGVYYYKLQNASNQYLSTGQFVVIK